MKRIVLRVMFIMVILIELQFPLYAAVKVETSLDMDKIEAMEAEIERNIELGYPSMNILVVKDGEVIYQNGFGYKNKYNGLNLLSNPELVTTDTMYDIASNSKMYATNFALQKLVYEGKLNLNDKVSSYLPKFVDGEADLIKGKSNLTVLQILQHTAGFPADPQYHNQSYANSLYSQDKALTLEKIYVTPLEYEPGTKNIYSDVDYMILGYLIEEITGSPLDVYVESEIFQPLGLTHTMYNPLQKGFSKNDFAATERLGNSRDGNISFNNIRDYTIQGEVHDEKAFYSMNGVSGHAGLFSNTADLGVLMQVMLNGGTYNDIKLFDSKVINEFTTPTITNNTYGLGWRLNRENKMAGTFGKLASDRTYGHTGWTGTVTVIDPEKNMAVVVLGNRPNSPLFDQSNLNVFASGKLPISSYGYVLDMIWDATTLKEEQPSIPSEEEQPSLPENEEQIIVPEVPSIPSEVIQPVVLNEALTPDSSSESVKQVEEVKVITTNAKQVEEVPLALSNVPETKNEEVPKNRLAIGTAIASSPLLVTEVTSDSSNVIKYLVVGFILFIIGFAIYKFK